MSEGPLFAGAALRRLRNREGLTQAAMASRLSISPSYLNLLERNQRPLSARVVVKVVDEFDFDPRALREDAAIGGVDGLVRRFADDRFAAFDVDRGEITELLASAPQAAAAFAHLYDHAGSDAVEGTDPLTASRREIERWRNHFADLDTAAEEMADEMRLSRAEIGAALTERLREKHQLSVRILPREIMPDALRRLDLHARQLQLSEMLDTRSRNFNVALQLARLERQSLITEFAAGAQLPDDTARALFERHLAAYFAAALIMPYGRFLRACEATGYDVRVLMRRFDVSFEQLAHRLTTLQRVGQRGLPFFMARVDRAGQFSKRFAGASGATLLDGSSSCPLWNIHEAFGRAGEFHMQSVSADGAGTARDQWFTIARTVDGSGAEGDARFVVVIGVEARLAGDLAQAKPVSLKPDHAQPIGHGCARCLRENCQQRSLPPHGTPLRFDRSKRGTTPFDFSAKA
ncbi:Propionyl-CoA carboxylase regulator [Alteripontixanthobacter maritimus]|uniref:Propionyl-CoA carboxylase regulator n=1 Tax=Alteripontixanthobacter maritimus TaxID=2161824 RepID=A0A369Q8Z9_9SPHN|nr:short-chain fatty acyl-CoA regulator family protein [Alteripontixanthobacter maritimus]RDC59737.1 Propionyl-CoA carboxylase regulator [Alteripontixanthobacter maritimus]